MSRLQDITSSLEDAFQQSLPVAKSKKPTLADWTSAIRIFNGKARKIRLEHKLGVFGRAIVAYRLQQRLLAAGFPAAVVRQVIFSMVINAFIA